MEHSRDTQTFEIPVFTGDRLTDLQALRDIALEGRPIEFWWSLENDQNIPVAVREAVTSSIYAHIDHEDSCRRKSVAPTKYADFLPEWLLGRITEQQKNQQELLETEQAARSTTVAEIGAIAVQRETPEQLAKRIRQSLGGRPRRDRHEHGKHRRR